jgi:hypothetical protein
MTSKHILPVHTGALGVPHKVQVSGMSGTEYLAAERLIAQNSCVGMLSSQPQRVCCSVTTVCCLHCAGGHLPGATQVCRAGGI